MPTIKRVAEADEEAGLEHAGDALELAVERFGIVDRAEAAVDDHVSAVGHVGRTVTRRRLIVVEQPSCCNRRSVCFTPIALTSTGSGHGAEPLDAFVSGDHGHPMV